MSSSTRNNAILTSLVDSYCLVCETHIRRLEEVYAHISKPVHKKNLDATQIVKKYQEDHILKVKAGYYCVYCNILFSILTKVSIHVAEAQHAHNKGLQLLRRVGQTVIAYNQFFIDEKAWDGIKEDTCVVCNVEFEKEDVHRSNPSHALNIILSKVKFGKNKEIYRKTDETTFQCITCNLVFAQDDFSAHFNGTKHQELLWELTKDYQKNMLKEDNNIKDISVGNNKGQNRHQDTLESFIEEICEDNENHSSSTKGLKLEAPPDNILNASLLKNETDTRATSILEFISTFERNKININFENEYAYCKRCNVNIGFNNDCIKKHIEGHIKIPIRVNSSYKPVQDKVNIKTSHYKTLHNKEINKPLLAITSSEHKDIEDSQQNNVKNMPCTKKNTNVGQNVILLSKDGDETIIFAKENQITYNKESKNAYCQICDKKFSSNLGPMKEHVQGKPHKKKCSSFHPKPTFSDASSSAVIKEKKHMKDFIDKIEKIECLLGNFIFVNDKYILTNESYHVITSNGSRYKCHVCKIEVYGYNLNKHIHLYQHVSRIKHLMVISSLQTEFVREICPELHHCGCCNLIVGTWEQLECHFISPEHKSKKIMTEFLSAVERNKGEIVSEMQRHFQSR